MQTDTLHTPLADIARLQPSSTRVFFRHRLDFCCGGRRTLTEACASAGLDAEQIARELAELTEPAPVVAWDERSQAELVEYIVTRYHDTLRRDVPPLIAAAHKVERVHADKPAVPKGLAAHLEAFWDDMTAHMQKEEQVLFPMLARGAHSQQVYMPVRMMEREHDAHAKDLATTRALTGDLEIPPHACGTWTALYRGLVALEQELLEHIHLENNVLFPRATR